MDLLKELEPYNRDLDLFKQGHGVTKHARDSVELRDIWRRLQIKEAKTIYGRADAAPIECKSCSPTMMKALVNWREIYKRKDTTYFKGVPEYKLEHEEDTDISLALVDVNEYHAEPFIVFGKDKDIEAEVDTDISLAEKVEIVDEVLANRKHTNEWIEANPEDKEFRIDSLKWGAFKTYCKEQGLSVKGKTKKELLKELGI